VANGTYIGIKDVRWNPLQKHELLLFNKVAVPFVDEALSHLHGTAPGADLEWLLEEGAVYLLPQPAPPARVVPGSEREEGSRHGSA
jgi:hypothetical protein